MTEYMAVRVAKGHGCEGCVFSKRRYPDSTKNDCHHPDVEHRNCSSRSTQDDLERIYVTLEKGALMRLRGEAL